MNKNLKIFKKYLTVSLLSFFLLSGFVSAKSSSVSVDLSVKDGTSWVDYLEVDVGTEIEFKAVVNGISGDLIAMGSLPESLIFTSADPIQDDKTVNENGETLIIWYYDGTNDILTFYFRAYATEIGIFTVKFLALVLPIESDNDKVTINIKDSVNSAPNKPSSPSGSSSGDVGVSYAYSSSTSDPDGDQVYYWFDWGDGSNSGWSGAYNSGQSCSKSHTWSVEGSYSVRVKAKDTEGHESQWSDSFMVAITGPVNSAPNKPSSPSGSSSGDVGVSYAYSSSTSDPDGDQVYYWFDWGDGSNSGWSGAYNSGQSCSKSHTWSVEGSYSVRVKAKDTEGHESQWSDSLHISMPKQKENIFYSTLSGFLIKYNKILPSIVKDIINLLLEKGVNNPPSIPSYFPLGENPVYDYYTNSIWVYVIDSDPYDKVRVGIDYYEDGYDGIVDKWTDYRPTMGEGTTIILSCRNLKTISVRLVAEDNHGAQSYWTSHLKTKTGMINLPFFVKGLINHSLYFL